MINKNRFATFSDDSTIKIWKGSPPYSEKPLFTLTGHTTPINTMLYMEEIDKLISCPSNNAIVIWDASVMSFERKIDNVDCASSNSIGQIDKGRVVVYENKGVFKIVNIEMGVIEKELTEQSIKKVYSLCMVYNKSKFICVCNKGLCVFDIKKEKDKTIKHTEGEICNCIWLNENKYLLCTSNGEFRKISI